MMTAAAHRARWSRRIRTSPASASVFGWAAATRSTTASRSSASSRATSASASADEIIRRLRPEIAKVAGRDALPAAGAGHQRRRTDRAHAISVHAAGSESRRAEPVGAEDAGADEEAPAAARCRLRSADQRARSSRSTIDRDQAARFGIQPQLIDETLYDAFGQRQVTQYFTQLNTYHVILEIRRSCSRTRARSSKLYIKSPITGQQVPLSTLVQVRHPARCGYLSINHQGQFPAVTLSFNLAPGVALGQAVDAIRRRRRHAACRTPITAPSRARRRRSRPR